MSALIDILNNGIPAETIGGVASATVLQLIDKIKTVFRRKPITDNELKKKIEDNADIRKALVELQNELLKRNIITKEQSAIIGDNEININISKKIDKDIKGLQKTIIGNNKATISL